MNYKELTQYLKDAYTLEKQLYIYQKIARQYEKRIQEMEKEKSTVYLYEWEERTPRRAHRTNYVIPVPEYKPKFLGKRKNGRGKREPVYGFRGTKDMFRNIPQRWWDREMEQLEKEERNKYRLFYIGILLGTAVIGLAGCLAMQNIIPAIVAIAIGAFGCYYVGSEKKKEYLPGDPFFEKFMAVYEKKYQQDLRRKRAEYAPKLEVLENEYQTYIAPKQEVCKALLQALYAIAEFPEEYQSHVAVTQMCDYLEQERCATLAEAIQLYEQEKEQGIIIADSEVSLYRLEKLEESMRLYVCMRREEEYILDKMKRQLIAGENTTTLQEFNKQANLNCEEIANRYKI